MFDISSWGVQIIIALLIGILYELNRLRG